MVMVYYKFYNKNRTSELLIIQNKIYQRKDKNSNLSEWKCINKKCLNKIIKYHKERVSGLMEL